MFLVYSNNTDITKNVKRNSLRITEQMNNRANTCSFSVDESVGHGSVIEIFTGFKLTQQANSGQAVLNVDNTFEFFQKFRNGDEIIVDIKGSNESRYTIQSINHTGKTITLTSNLSVTLQQWKNCGKLEFSGVTMKNPDERIGYSDQYSYSVNATDWTKQFDAKVIVETFLQQYAREMFGRVVYEYCANNDQLNLDLFESAWTQGGNGLAMSAETTDRIQGTNSMKTGTSGSGTSTWTKTITTVDASAMDRFRIWFKIAEGSGNRVTALRFRVGTNSSNYYQGSSEWVGYANENCWNYESFDFDKCSIVGSPSKSTISWIQIEVSASATIPSGGLLFDHMLVSDGGFTVKKCIRGDRMFEDVRVQYKKPTVFVEEVCKLQNFFWFIDYERNLNFFKNGYKSAPFQIDNSSLNFSDLKVTADISQLRNRQTVRGGEAVDDNVYEQQHECDGIEKSFRLDYKPKGLRVYVDLGAGWIEKTVGVENLVDETSVDFVFNFNEKILRNAAFAVIPQTKKIKFTYYPYKPIRVRVMNTESVNAMKLLLGGDGIYDGPVINDASIKDWNEARIRAKAEIEAYSNPIITASFDTEVEGLKAGQIIRIIDSGRSIDQDFLIQRVSKKSKEVDYREYSIECGSTVFGLIEFFQLLLKRSEKLLIDVSEIVDIVQNQDETITFSESYSRTKKSKTFLAGSKHIQGYKALSMRGYKSTSGTLDQALIENGGSLIVSHRNIEQGMTRQVTFDGLDAPEVVGGLSPSSVIGTVPVADRFGNKYTARTFDGTASLVTYTVASYSNPDEISFLIRHKPTAASGQRTLIYYAGHVIQANQAMIRVYSIAAGEYHEYARTNSGTWETIGITMSFLTNEKKFYLNGLLVQTSTIAVGKYGSSRTSINVGYDGTSNYYQGDIEEIQVYQAKILTAIEMENLSNGYDGDARSINLLCSNYLQGGSYSTGIYLKGSTQYRFDSWLQIIKKLTGGAGGITIKLCEFAGQKTGYFSNLTPLATTTIATNQVNVQDYKNYTATFTTQATTTYCRIYIDMLTIEGLARIGNLKLTDSSTDSSSNPGIASLSEST